MGLGPTALLEMSQDPQIGIKWSVGARQVSLLGTREARTLVVRKMKALSYFLASAPEMLKKTKE